MTESIEPIHMNYNELKSHIESEILKKSTKLKYNYPPITEKVSGVLELLKIKNIYQLNKPNANIFLFITSNPRKKPRYRYFLAILMASHSSDLLAILAKNVVKDELGMKLIQFSLYPKNFRTGLLSFKEITSVKEVNEILELLNKVRTNFRKSLKKVKNLVESN